MPNADHSKELPPQIIEALKVASRRMNMPRDKFLALAQTEFDQDAQAEANELIAAIRMGGTVLVGLFLVTCADAENGKPISAHSITMLGKYATFAIKSLCQREDVQAVIFPETKPQ
jgi:hypothetical protein